MAFVGRRPVIVGVVACLALGVTAAVARERSPTAPVASYAYPPNARQLIAAGLTGRPMNQGSSSPVTIDMALVDGTQTTVLFRSVGGGGSSPSLTLSDDRGRVYQPLVTAMSGAGFAMLPRPRGWGGALWDLLRIVPFVGPRLTAHGYATFASLSPAVREANVYVTAGGQTQVARIPLRLTALRTLTAISATRRRVSTKGVVVTVTRVSRGLGSAEVVYTVDTPPSLAGSPDGVLRDARGRQLIPTGGSGRCATPIGRAARMRCDSTILFTAPRSGAPLRLIVTASGGGAFPERPWSCRFKYPDVRTSNGRSHRPLTSSVAKD